jgi:RNA polymerase sigma-70 factor (ECF subfamily)
MEQATVPSPAQDQDGSPARGLDDFDAVVRSYQPKIFRFALASLRDRDAAETIAQDCLWRAYKARDTFRYECSIETWLMQIAVNLVRDHVRSRQFKFWKRAQTAAEPVEALDRWLSDDEPCPESRALLKEQVQAVWSVAGTLPERQRTVFLLRFVEDMDLLEIAAATKMKVHLFRALQTIRERMGARR